MSTDKSERESSRESRPIIIVSAFVIAAAAVCCFIMFSDSDNPVTLEGDVSVMNLTMSFDPDSGVTVIGTEEDKMFAIAFTAIIVAEVVFMLALARYFCRQSI